MELGLTLGAPTNKITDLALALGVYSRDTHHQQEPSRSDGDRTVSIDPPFLCLDLVPLPSSQETATTGSSEGGSSGAATRAFTMNRVPEAVAGEEVSSPNSVDRTTSSRGASDEDETGHTRKKLRLSKEQSAFLEESFKEHHTLNPKQKQALAKQLNLRPRQVEVWFQNRRARTKLKQTEVDCEYLKRCCETLSEENRRLHKELQELRALKSSNPYHMQLPATTLTMCPSCERTTTAKSSATTATTTNTFVASTTTTDSSSKPTPFPISMPKFFPFSSQNNQPQKSMAL